MKDFFKEKRWKNWRKDQWLVVFLIGVLVLVIAIPTGSKGSAGDATTSDQGFFKGKNTNGEALESTIHPTTIENTEETRSYEEYLEQQLEEILARMQGVGQVEVMITLKNNGERIVEKDVQSSYTVTSNGMVQDAETEGQTTQRQTSEVTIYEDQSEEGNPYVSKELLPRVEGVLVVAQGGDHAATASNISEAIQALFDLEIHKIKIVKMNAQEGTN